MVAKPFDPRQSRLELERQRMEQLNKDSDHVKAEPVDVLPGRAPEKYKVTFFCRGIGNIDSRQTPQYAEKHEVMIVCDQTFPTDVPRLQWLTPIWHPNIQHDGSKNVCVNKAEWLGGMGVDDLCHQMFEMVQYQNYHAENTPPYPLDSAAAKWVREYAEPRGIVDKRRHIFVDNKPFYRASGPKLRFTIAETTTSPSTRIKILGTGAPGPNGSGRAAAPPVGTTSSRIKIQKYSAGDQ